MTDYQSLIDRYYPAGSPLRDIYMRHCRSVADEALTIARRKNLPLPEAMTEGAAMTHDIGIFLTSAPSIECRGTEPYIRHGILGAALLRREGAPEEWARVAERHTGAGLTAAEIASQHLPLPHEDLVPETLPTNSTPRAARWSASLWKKCGRRWPASVRIPSAASTR